MSLDERIASTDAPPPAPPHPQPRPLEAVPVAAHTALSVAPGQTLVLAVSADRAASPEQAAELARSVKERLPGVEVLVLAGVEQMAVFDPGQAPASPDEEEA